MILLALAAAALPPLSAESQPVPIAPRQCYYTGKQIEDLRQALDSKFTWGRYSGPDFEHDPNCRSDKNGSVCQAPVKYTADKDAYLQSMLPAFIQACKTAEELKAEDAQYWAPIPAKEPDIRPATKAADYVICYGQSSSICDTVGRKK